MFVLVFFVKRYIDLFTVSILSACKSKFKRFGHVKCPQTSGYNGQRYPTGKSGGICGWKSMSQSDNCHCTASMSSRRALGSCWFGDGVVNYRQNIYGRKRIGPRTIPWETPEVTLMAEDIVSTVCCLIEMIGPSRVLVVRCNTGVVVGEFVEEALARNFVKCFFEI